MTFTIYGIDNEFASATGDNVGVTEDTSRFDNPPNGSKDLVITTRPDDPDPRSFDLGDTYEIAWGGSAGGGFISDATVVRSDGSPDGGIIVFEGRDANGEIAQIVWTPGIDLEGWYNDNYNPSNEPRFYTTDTNSAYSHSFVCFAAGTLIETPAGPRRVETLRPGHQVITRDAGAQRVIWTGQRSCVGAGADAPVCFDEGAVGNDRPLNLSRQHRVMIRSPLLELHLGVAEALAPAHAFVGLPGIRAAPRPTVTYVHLLLAEHHILTANGAAAESLHLGPQARALFRDDPVFAETLAAHGLLRVVQRAARPMLSGGEARSLLAMCARALPDPARVETLQLH